MFQVRAFAAVLLASLVAACGAGRNFAMPADGALKLGVTTTSDALSLLGAPYQKNQETVTSVATTGGPVSVFSPIKQPGTYDRFTYIFLDTSRQGVISGALAGGRQRPERVLQLVFWNGKLVSYGSNSSFENDSTNFDENRIAQIERGRTRGAEVVQMMGKLPSGTAIYPMIAAPEGRTITYNFSEADLPNNERHRKFLAVYLDRDDVVRDMQSENTTNPLPIQPAAPAPGVVPIFVPRGK
ncbi:MAG TPA: hypothetical protein VGU20_24000 [Stellaceae bacterium]|nr:hypothetical protein [Stellaceae bacterium]